ncbi:hypothetical protein V6N13_013942 [Hibiscus sabdariffa]
MERATWLELSGIPIHCWNDTTLKRLADLWGNFEAVGENAAHTKDCEKVIILITTEISNRIEEVVEICRVDNDSESTSDPSEKMAPTVSPDGEGTETRSAEKDGSFNETCFGNDYGEKLNTNNEAGSRLGEMDLMAMGDSFKVTPQNEKGYQVSTFYASGIDISIENQEKENESTKQTMDNCWAEMDAMGQDVSMVNLEENELSSNLLTKRAIDDIRCMGFGHKSNEMSGVGKSAWAKKLDNKINTHIIGNERNGLTKLSNCEADSEEEIDRIFFPELDSEKKKRLFGQWKDVSWCDASDVFYSSFCSAFSGTIRGRSGGGIVVI